MTRSDIDVDVILDDQPRSGAVSGRPRPLAEPCDDTLLARSGVDRSRATGYEADDWRRSGTASARDNVVAPSSSLLSERG